MIYFIQAQPSGNVKIGFTTSLRHRLRALQTSTDQTLTILRLFQGTRDDEQMLHERFQSLHIKREWFRFSPDLLAVDLPIIDVPNFRRQRRVRATIPSLIVDQFGGTRAMARLLGLPPTTIQSWKTRGFIPARQQHAIMAAANREKIDIKAEDFFGLRQREAA